MSALCRSPPALLPSGLSATLGIERPGLKKHPDVGLSISMQRSGLVSAFPG
ncbi:hypothetical protein EM20IM_08290 [Candidatus Methylacidiphilum infernorum]|uniref:Uncharacterized protein n=1 Tax=Candidatus Methylacidiphilum infernorum TaxID=511746 RepID=A0ABX7PUX7_9BACT|nr:hypothetical protein [Candidatus Methylacidiphilum infernorum]QSR86483.1 hypothetical protein EM20IM_08290 [Candidatus Methylacidiphilum infernorum]